MKVQMSIGHDRRDRLAANLHVANPQNELEAVAVFQIVRIGGRGEPGFPHELAPLHDFSIPRGKLGNDLATKAQFAVITYRAHLVLAPVAIGREVPSLAHSAPDRDTHVVE